MMMDFDTILIVSMLSMLITFYAVELFQWHKDCGRKWNTKFFIGAFAWTGFMSVAIMMLGKIAGII